MADEPKQPWYKTVPGTLTAATGFIAALSGLVAGINQLGLFKREQPAPQAASAPAPAASAPVAPSTVASGGSSNAGGSSAKGEESSTAPPGAAAPKPQRPASPAPATPSTGPAAPSGAAPKPAPAAAGDTTTRAQRLPSGTKLELAVPTRTCAADGKEERFTARLIAPVRVGDATVLAAKTTAVLYLKKSGSSTPDVRLESVIRQKQPISVRSSDVQVTSGAGAGCLRAGARLTATLNAPVTVRR